MLELSNHDRKELRQAIESAYSPSDFKLFFSEELQTNLDLISSPVNSHRTVIFDVIQWANGKGYIDDLILALSKDTENPAIQRFCQRVLRLHLLLNPAEPAPISKSLPFDSTRWDFEIHEEELQAFLPKQFSFEADVGTLQRGLELANSVCKITFHGSNSEATGTGVLIAPDLVLTNYHVLSKQADADLQAIAKTAQFEFGYVHPKFGEVAQTYRLQCVEAQPVLASSWKEELDYVLLRLQPHPKGAMTPVPCDFKAQLTPRSPLNLLQHPDGEAMKVSLSNNGVVKTNDAQGLVLYVNPTKSGSSGSPCFDQNWNLVALHHKEMATSFGSIREGILLSAIYPQISSVL